jgi:hypothetical protein
MALRFYVTYDLKKPGQNYPELWKRLTELGGVRLLESVWLLIGDDASSAAGLRDILRHHIDRNDRLLVVTGEAAWVNLMADPSKV